MGQALIKTIPQSIDKESFRIYSGSNKLVEELFEIYSDNGIMSRDTMLSLAQTVDVSIITSNQYENIKSKIKESLELRGISSRPLLEYLKQHLSTGNFLQLSPNDLRNCSKSAAFPTYQLSDELNIVSKARSVIIVIDEPTLTAISNEDLTNAAFVDFTISLRNKGYQNIIPLITNRNVLTSKNWTKCLKLLFDEDMIIEISDDFNALINALFNRILSNRKNIKFSLTASNPPLDHLAKPPTHRSTGFQRKSASRTIIHNSQSKQDLCIFEFINRSLSSSTEFRRLMISSILSKHHVDIPSVLATKMIESPIYLASMGLTPLENDSISQRLKDMSLLPSNWSNSYLNYDNDSDMNLDYILDTAINKIHDITIVIKTLVYLKVMLTQATSSAVENNCSKYQMILLPESSWKIASCIMKIMHSWYNQTHVIANGIRIINLLVQFMTIPSPSTSINNEPVENINHLIDFINRHHGFYSFIQKLLFSHIRVESCVKEICKLINSLLSIDQEQDTKKTIVKQLDSEEVRQPSFCSESDLQSNRNIAKLPRICHFKHPVNPNSDIARTKSKLHSEKFGEASICQTLANAVLIHKISLEVSAITMESVSLLCHLNMENCVRFVLSNGCENIASSLSHQINRFEEIISQSTSPHNIIDDPKFEQINLFLINCFQAVKNICYLDIEHRNRFGVIGVPRDICKAMTLYSLVLNANSSFKVKDCVLAKLTGEVISSLITGISSNRNQIIKAGGCEMLKGLVLQFHSRLDVLFSVSKGINAVAIPNHIHSDSEERSGIGRVLFPSSKCKCCLKNVNFVFKNILKQMNHSNEVAWKEIKVEFEQSVRLLSMSV